ncbi:MAG: GNAT family N-acetyltransferase [Phycisphaerales bacterium]|nr:MAG: GNAT family N-acetyltransferase [Phycisphaerales bacterium]
MEPLIRPMQVDDIEYALAQKAREGWDIAESAFAIHLEHDPNGCFIAEVDGRAVAMITSTRYRDSAFIGNLIVEPEHRRQGIGQMLMACAMQALRDRGINTFHLEADPPGVNLYRTLGFVDVFESLRFECEAPSRGQTAGEREVRVLCREDAPRVGEYDRAHFGDDRAPLLASLLEQSPAAFWISEGDRTAGYLITQELLNGLRIGPWVADGEDAAASLLDEVLTRTEASRYALGIPGVNEIGVKLLQSRGFTATPPCLHMVRGDRSYCGMPRNIFAITGGDRG